MAQKNQSGQRKENANKHFVFVVLVIVNILALFMIFDLMDSIDNSVRQGIGYPTHESMRYAVPTKSESPKTVPAEAESPAPAAEPATPAINVDFPRPSLLLAVADQDQSPAPSNPDNLRRDFRLIAYAPTDGSRTEIATLASNFFVSPFRFADDALYFISPSGELKTLDFASRKIKTIALEGILPTERYQTKDTLSDILATPEAIYFLKGICGERGYCALGRLDLATGASAILLDNLQEKVDSGMFSIISFGRYDPSSRKLQLQVRDGDGGWASLDIYQFDPNSGTIAKTDSTSFAGFCGASDLVAECDAAQKANNEKYLRLTAAPMECAGATVSDSTEKYLELVIEGDKPASFSNAYYAGCAE